MLLLLYLVLQQLHLLQHLLLQHLQLHAKINKDRVCFQVICTFDLSKKVLLQQLQQLQHCSCEIFLSF